MKLTAPYVLTVTGSPEMAWREIWHYAAMYGQDGPVEIREVLPNPSHPKGEQEL